MQTCCPHCGALLTATDATVTVRGQQMGIGQGLAQVFGGRDPALAKLDADRKKIAPMPDSVRKANAILRADILAKRADRLQNLNKPKA
jgi:hypothetical protein